MATTAGGMTTTPGGNPQWRSCDGSIISAFQNPLPPQTSRPHAGTSYGSYRDWVLRMEAITAPVASPCSADQAAAGSRRAHTT